MPIAIHIIKRSQLSFGKDNIISKQTITPSKGTTGTNGALNFRGISGIVLRMIMTPMHTRIKANNVPIETICPKSETGTNPENRLTKSIKNIFVFQGV